MIFASHTLSFDFVSLLVYFVCNSSHLLETTAKRCAPVSRPAEYSQSTTNLLLLATIPGGSALPQLSYFISPDSWLLEFVLVRIFLKSSSMFGFHDVRAVFFPVYLIRTMWLLKSFSSPLHHPFAARVPWSFPFGQ